MKKINFFALVTAAVCVLAACSQEKLFSNEQENTLNLPKGTYGTIPAIELTTFDGAASSDTKVSINPQTLAFGWQVNDEIAVVPMDGVTNETNYTVKTVQGDSTLCSFDGGAWTLKEGLTYSAYRPYKNTTYKSTDKVIMTHSIQVQHYNGSTSDVPTYMHMYADAVTNTDGTVNFQFRHLSSILNFLIDAPATATYTELKVTASDEIFANGSFKISDGTTTASGSKYKTLTVKLNNFALTEGDLLSVFATMLPWDYTLTNKIVMVTLTDDEENEYTFSTVFGKVKAGKGYQMYCTPAPSTTTFKSVIDLKQAIYDAGYTDFSKVKGINIYTCVDFSSYEPKAQVNANLPDEEPLYLCYVTSNYPVLATNAQKIKLPRYCTNLFNGFENLVSAGLEDWTSDKIDASQVISLESMFEGCKEIMSVNLEFLSDNPGIITTTKKMFDGCKKLDYVKMTALAGKVSNVTDMEGMFSECSLMTTVDMNGWDTKSLEKCDNMFYECASLKSIDLTNLNTTKVTRMNNLLYGCVKAANVTLGPNFAFPSSGTTGMFSDLGNNSFNRPEFNTTFHCSSTQWTKIQNIIGSSLIDNYRWAGTGMLPDGATFNAALPSGVTKVTFKVSTTPISGETAVFTNVFKSVSGTEVTFRIESGKFILSTASAKGMFKDKKSLATITGLEKIDWTGVTDMSEMFSGCKALTGIDFYSSNLTGSDLTNMSMMFLNCSGIIPSGLRFPAKFSTANVTDMSYMFCGCSGATKDFIENQLNTSSLVNASNMLAGTKYNGHLDLRKWDVRKVTTMESMFYNSKFESIKMDGWKTNSLQEVKDMFAKCENLMSLSIKFNVSKVGSFLRMFAGCSLLNYLDLSSFDACPDNMDEMFKGCSHLQTLDISKMKTAGASMYSTFNGCEYMNKLTVGTYFSLSKLSQTNLTFKDFGTVWKTNNPSLKTEIDCPVSVWENRIKYALANQYDDSEDRFYCSRKAVLPSANDFHDAIMTLVGNSSFINKVSFIYSNTPLPEEGAGATAHTFFDYSGAPIFVSWNSSNGQITVRTPGEKYFLNKNSGGGMFKDFIMMKSIEGLELIDTNEAESMSSMFSGCKSLESLNLSNFNTSNVTKMNWMFNDCWNLRNLDVSGFNTSNVIYMDYMFQECNALKGIDVSKFNTSKTLSFWGMFEGCGSLITLDIRNFDFSTCLNASLGYSPTNVMFRDCYQLETLYLSPSFDPRGKDGPGWHAITDNYGKTTFENMGTYSSSQSVYYSIFYGTSSQLEVIKQCLTANGQSVDKYRFTLFYK